MQASSENDTLFEQMRQNFRGLDIVGEIDGSHAVGLISSIRGKLFETVRGYGGFDVLGYLAVAGEAGRKGLGEDLSEGGVESVYELGRWGGKVRGFFRFIVAHYCKKVISQAFQTARR